MKIETIKTCRRRTYDFDLFEAGQDEILENLTANATGTDDQHLAGQDLLPEHRSKHTIHESHSRVLSL